MQDLTYTYDNNGNITQIVDASNTNSSKTVAYVYDDLNRMTSAAATNVASGQSTYTKTYTYNAIGNITAGDAGTYTYAGDQGSSYANPHAVTSTSTGSVTYTYDNNGNLLTETNGLSNTWDYNNRLAQAIKGGVTSTYAYDSTGQRVKLANGTTTTYYPTKFYNIEGKNVMQKKSPAAAEAFLLMSSCLHFIKVAVSGRPGVFLLVIRRKSQIFADINIAPAGDCYDC